MQNNENAPLRDIIVTISDYKAELKRRILLIFSIAIIFSLIGLGFSKLQKNQYEAVLSFIVDDQSEGTTLSSISGMASQFGLELGGGSSSSLSQKDVIELLKSRLIIEKTLNNKCTIGGKSDLLLNHYVRINNLIPDSSIINFSTNYKDSITTVLCSMINERDMNILFQNNEANILNLSFRSLNPKFAKKFSSIIIDEMTNDYKRNKTERSRIILNKLERRADSINIQLATVQKKWYNAVKRDWYSDNKLDEKQYEVEMLHLGVVLQELRKNIEISYLSLLDDTPLITVVDKPVLPFENINRSTVFWIVTFSLLGLFTIILIIILRKLIRDALQEEG